MENCKSEQFPFTVIATNYFATQSSGAESCHEEKMQLSEKNVENYLLQ